MARHPQTSSQICRVHKKVADSGDGVIRKRWLSIVDTRVPAIAMTPLSFCRKISHRNLHLDIRAHRNQILSGARRRGARRLSPPGSSGLHRVESARQSLGDGANAQRDTYVDWTDIRDCFPSASLRNPDLLGSKRQESEGTRRWCQSMVGSPDDGKVFDRGLYDTFSSPIADSETWLRGR